MFTSLITAWVHSLWPNLNVFLLAFIFVGLLVGGYAAGYWVSFERPKELAKKIAINSKELRRRKKEFFDWLASQGRR
jgi:hypothetical protein